MTAEAIKEQGLRIWRVVEILGTIGAVVVSTLLASGWSLQKPGEVIASLETRVTKVESNYAMLNDTMNDVLRLQCLSISRHDANLAGTCTDIPTRDDSLRGSR